jgi:hypothetical protein
MSNSKLAYAAVWSILVCLTTVLSALAQSGKVTTIAVDNLYLAKGDGTGKPGEPAEWFYSTEVPIYVVVMIEPAKAAAITMRFVAVEVPGLKPDSKILSTNYNLPEGSNTVWFTGRPFGSNWIGGRYRVDILLDGSVAKSQEFEIRKVAGVEKTTTFAPQRSRPKKVNKKPLLIFN